MLVGGTPTSNLPESSQFFCFSVSPLPGGCSSPTWMKSSSGLQRSASASSKLRSILRPDRGRPSRISTRCARYTSNCYTSNCYTSNCWTRWGRGAGGCCPTPGCWWASTAFPRRVVQERRAPEGTRRPVKRPAASTPRDEPIPTEGPPGRTWLAGCIVHRDLPLGAPGAEVKINGRPFPALLDRKCGQPNKTLRPRSLRGDQSLPPNQMCTWKDSTCAGPERDHLSCTWRLAGGSGCTEGSAGLGRVWPGFDRLLAAAPERAAGGKSCWKEPSTPRLTGIGQRDRWWVPSSSS